MPKEEGKKDIQDLLDNVDSAKFGCQHYRVEFVWGIDKKDRKPRIYIIIYKGDKQLHSISVPEEKVWKVIQFFKTMGEKEEQNYIQ